MTPADRRRLTESGSAAVRSPRHARSWSAPITRLPSQLRCLGLAWVIVLVGCTAGGPARGALPLRRVGIMALPGDTSRFDYASLDAGRRRLFIAHLGRGEVLVVDTSSRRVIGRIPVPGVHGVLAVPALGTVYASASAVSEEVAINADILAVPWHAPTGGTPDGISYDPVERRVFVSDETGGDLTVLDARTGARIGAVKLTGEAGNNVYDPATGLVLVDDQSHDTLDVVDPVALRVIGGHQLPGCDHDHGLILDPDNRRAYVACDGNNQLLTVDLATFAVTGRVSTGDGPDVLSIDPGLHRLYVAAESGDWTVLDITADTTRLIARRHLADGAHTAAVDPDSHLVYVPLADAGGHPALEILTPT